MSITTTPCDAARDRMQERAEGSLRPSDAAAVDAHVAACAGCRQEMARWNALLSSLESMPEAPVPEGFARSVMSDLPEMLPAAEGAGHVLRWGVFVAVLLSAFASGLAMLVHEGGPEAARLTLQPIGASFQLGGVLFAQAAAALAVALGALSHVIDRLSVAERVLAVVAFAAINGALLAFFAKLQPKAHDAALLDAHDDDETDSIK